MVVFGIIVFGIGLFYQQQVTNAAREAARYAAIHSASSDCPVAGSLAPLHPKPAGAGPWDCEVAPWPSMLAHARGYVAGMNAAQLNISACWSGYVDDVTGFRDAGPVRAGGDPNNPTDRNRWADCTIGSGINPMESTSALPCPATSGGADQASNLAVSPGLSGAEAANRVVVYACYPWSPPMAGFLGIPSQIVFKAVISEGLQHQR
jgi:hypothetical protein